MNQENAWIVNKHVLITGASSGIGRELSKNLLGICRKLTLIARNVDGKLTVLEKELKDKVEEQSLKTEIEIHSVDICNRKGMREIIRKIYEEDSDQVEAIINSAGGSHVYGPFETMSDYDIDTIFDTNAKAPIFILRELLPRMKNNIIEPGEKKRGHVIFLSSRSGERALPNLSVYAVAKGAIEQLCSAMRVEYVPYGIGFTLINPGSINTNFTQFWTREHRDAHNAESMTVEESVQPILQVLNLSFVINKISYESVKQWSGEPGVLKLWG
jgi:short-subunit dehydrogenase